MTTELAVRDHSVGDIEIMAKQVGKSGLFGMNESQAFTLMLLAQAKGIHPIQAVERYHIISGRPAMKADAMLADFQARGGVVKWGPMTDTECSATFFHPKNAPDGVPVSFTIADARKAQLTGNKMWEKYPKNMLRSRVISNGIRIVDPGIVAGIYTPEEVGDFDDAPSRPAPAVADNRPTSEKVKERRAEDDRQRAEAKKVVDAEFKPAEKPAEQPATNAAWTVEQFEAWLKKAVDNGNAWWSKRLVKLGIDADTLAKAQQTPFSTFRLVGHLCKWFGGYPEEGIIGQAQGYEGLIKEPIDQKHRILAEQFPAWQRPFETELKQYMQTDVPEQIMDEIKKKAEKAARPAKAEPEALQGEIVDGPGDDSWEAGRE